MFAILTFVVYNAGMGDSKCYGLCMECVKRSELCVGREGKEGVQVR